MNVKKLLKPTLVALLGGATFTLTHSTALAAKAKCPADSVKVGNVCVDKYEASVWEIPSNNTALITKVQQGTATLADLTAGGVQRGLVFPDDYPCDDNGNDCDDIYAVSIPGVKPSVFITWFQAQQACGNASKRLLTNAEWQMAAAGTPDPGTDNGSTSCNITNQGFPANDPVNTGSRSNCQSRWGVFDMVGNVNEWVADWVPAATSCSGPLFDLDNNCMTIDPTATTSYSGPAALTRGGSYSHHEGAGVFSIEAQSQPSIASFVLGFRCGR